MSLIVMLKKETVEFIRTYKMLILFAVFILFAIMSPLTAKFMPEILSYVLPKEIAESFSEPTSMDSWAQFFKNFSQMGLFLLTILFANSLIHEKSDGTLTLLLTKGLSRKTVYLAKLIFAIFIWTVSYFLSFFITYFYTWYYWNDQTAEHLFIAVSHLWLFGIFLLTVIFLGNALFRSVFANFLFVGGVVAVLLILSIFPKADPLNVFILATDHMEILQNGYVPDDFIWTYIIAGIGSIFFSWVGIAYFMKNAI